MNIILMLLFPLFTFADVQIPPTPFPVFLRQGFSTILEFEEVPTKVVLGDGQSFLIEKLDRSIVVKTIEPYAVSNMFVYFRNKPPKLFVLNASEESEPTYYKKFETLKPPAPVLKKPLKTFRRATLRSAIFDRKKDHLTVEITLSADSTTKLMPEWNRIRLSYKDQRIEPKSLWSERKEVQKDSSVKARFIFVRPNISKDLEGANLIVPLKGQERPFEVSLRGKQ